MDDPRRLRLAAEYLEGAARAPQERYPRWAKAEWARRKRLETKCKKAATSPEVAA